MAARMDILNFSMLLLLLMGNSNGDKRPHQSLYKLVPPMNLPLETLLDQHLIRKLQLVPTDSETHIMSLLNHGLSGSFDKHSSLPLKRQKRQIPIPNSSLSHDFLLKDKRGIIGAYVFIGGETNLNRVENKLNGFKGKLDNIDLSVLKREAETKIFKQITKLIRDTSINNIQRNFDMTHKLIRNGILEDHGISVVLQGMIGHTSKLNKLNLAEVKVTIKEVENFINREINKAKTDIHQGFELVSDSSDGSKIKPLVSRLLNLITGFKQRLNHLQSLSKENQEIKTEIERSGGYYEYLQPSTLQDTLYGIINADLAIPFNDSDTTALALLELLVIGLQIHANLLSFVVSANVYDAEEALRNRNFEEFNMHMIQVESAMSRVKTAMGNSGLGLLGNVTTVLDKVEQKLDASRFHDLNQLLNDKRIEVNQVETDINNMIETIDYVPKPEALTKELDFDASSIILPIGHWERGKTVSYAIQYVSRNGLSEVSDWSRPYGILDKAHPTVHIPTTGNGMTRLVYRKFDEDKPELVAVLTDEKQNSFRDINKDIVNVALRRNSKIREVTALLDDGANVNVTFENEMTPLHYAAKYGNVKVMNILISKNADVCAKSLDGEEPIHLAALSDATEAIQILAKEGADVNAQTRLLGLSPLHIAVANNYGLAVDYLINAGASVNMKDNSGLSPLHYAVAGNGEALEVLLKRDDLRINSVTKSGLTPLHLAVVGPNGVLVRKLLKRRDINVNPVPDSNLYFAHLASIYENKDIIGSLVQGGIPTDVVDKDGSTPLHYATFYGNIESILALAVLDESSKGVLNKDNKTALDVAIEKNRDNSVYILRANGQNISEVIEELQTNNNVSFMGNTTDIPTPKCNQEIGGKIISSSGEICKHVGHVDSYVNFVNFMIPLKKYYEGQKDYTKIFTDYDDDLEAAQDHAKLWRDGDSIVISIRKTFDLAKEFEPEFRMKYMIHKMFIQRLKSEVVQVKKGMVIRAEITRLEDDISKLKQMLQLSTNQFMTDTFHELISSNQERLSQQKMMLTSDYPITLEVSELANFYEFVKEDTLKINETATRTREKIEIFKSHLMKDKTAFIRHSNISKIILDGVTNDSTTKNERLAAMMEDKEKLESEIQVLKGNITEMDDNILNIYRELSERSWEVKVRIGVAIGSNIGIAVGCVGLAFIPFAGPILAVSCVAGLAVSIGLQTTYLINLKKNVDLDSVQLQALETMLVFKKTKRGPLQKVLMDASTDSDRLQEEGYQLIMVEQDLETVLSYSDKLVKALDRSLVGMTVVKDVFDGVTQTLDDMMALARTSGDAAAKQNTLYFLYEEISEMECDWEDVYYSVMNLEQCTRNWQILNLN